METTLRTSLAAIALLAGLSVLSATCAAQGKGETKAAPANDAGARDELARRIEAAAAHPAKNGGVSGDYVNAWVRAVESAGDGLVQSTRGEGGAGEVVLSVEIGKDGNVAETRVLRSSGDAALDQAVIRVIRSATPFAPVPSEVGDTLYITRTWRALPTLQARRAQADGALAPPGGKPDLVIRSDWPQGFHDSIRYRRVAAAKAPGGQRSLREYRATLDVAVRQRGKDATTFSWTYTHMTLNGKPLHDLALELSVTSEGVITLLNSAQLRSAALRAVRSADQSRAEEEFGGDVLANYAQDEAVLRTYYLRDAHAFFYPQGITVHRDKPTEIDSRLSGLDSPLKVVDRWIIPPQKGAPAGTVGLEWTQTMDPRDVERYFSDYARRLDISIDPAKGALTKQGMFMLDETTFWPHVVFVTNKQSVGDEREQFDLLEMRSSLLDPNWKH